MKVILRATRWLVASVITLHVASLKGAVKRSENVLNRDISRSDTAKIGLYGAQEAVRLARASWKEARNIESQSRAAFNNAAMAASAEAKFYGRGI